MLCFENEDLAMFLRRVSYAGNADPIGRPAIGDRVHIRQTKEGFEMICTDGHRLARIAVEDTRYSEKDELFGASYSLGILATIQKSLLNSAKIRFASNEIIADGISVKAEYQEFPEIERLFPTTDPLLISADRKTLQWEVKSAITKAKDAGIVEGIKGFGFKISEGHVFIFCLHKRQDVIELEHAIIAGNLHAINDVGFNAIYLEEALRRSLKNPITQLDIFGELDPCIMRNEELFRKHTIKTTCILMPVRL